jgi:hypothetical protein
MRRGDRLEKPGKRSDVVQQETVTTLAPSHSAKKQSIAEFKPLIFAA